MTSMNLATALKTRFEQSGRMEDLEESISLYRTALDLRPTGHPLRSSPLMNLTNALETRFEQVYQEEDREEAIELLQSGARHEFSSSLTRLQSAVRTTTELLDSYWRSFGCSLCPRWSTNSRRLGLKKKVGFGGVRLPFCKHCRCMLPERGSRTAGVERAIVHTNIYTYQCQADLSARPSDFPEVIVSVCSKSYALVSQMPNSPSLRHVTSAEQTVDSAHDEVLHLAAGVQSCGFRSVIGTMWAMLDEDGPVLAQEFYAHMSAGDGMLGFKRSTRALHKATREMRKKKVALESWVNFVHIGA